MIHHRPFDYVHAVIYDNRFCFSVPINTDPHNPHPTFSSASSLSHYSSLIRLILEATLTKALIPTRLLEPSLTKPLIPTRLLEPSLTKPLIARGARPSATTRKCPFRARGNRVSAPFLLEPGIIEASTTFFLEPGIIELLFAG